MKYIKKFEATSRGQKIVYTFQTKAKSGNNHEYTIHLLEGDPKYDETNGITYDGLVISFESTPGSWYVTTFLHYGSDSQRGNIISISGNDWICTNKQEIIKELKDWIDNRFPIWREIEKYNL